MRKLFGKNDPVFGVKYEKAAADMEKNIRDVAEKSKPMLLLSSHLTSKGKNYY